MNDIFETKVNDFNLYVEVQIVCNQALRLIFIYQRAYIEQILHEYEFHDSSSISIPID